MIRLTILVVAQVLSLLLFSLGFFNWHHNQHKITNSDNIKLDEEYNNTTRREPVYDKMIFMVIDALRADFIDMGMPWVSEFVKGNPENVQSFIANAHAPTVTLPRLKALTGGIIPGFLDLLLNLVDNTDQVVGGMREDSWMKRAWEEGLKIQHYGDDTWFRLFPSPIIDVSNSHGVHSFFVLDTVEVDLNVTRHLDEIFLSTEETNTNIKWDIVTLHYLGVDHVGHVGGVKSPLMMPKLLEMDGVVERIYGEMGEDTLFVVVGDHGMTEGGNHGGSSREERETGCIFMSKKKFTDIKTSMDVKRIEQVGVAPTISLLLGLPIPRDSIGDLILSVIPVDRQNEFTMINAKHLANKLNVDLTLEVDAIEFGREASRKLIELKANEYNLPLMLAGLFLSIGCSALVVIRYQHFKSNIIMMFTLALYALTQLSSSFIEEEHEFWYFAFITASVYQFYLKPDHSHIISVLLMRILKYWNSTGYLYRNDPDIASLLKSNSSLQYGCVILAILIVMLVLHFKIHNRWRRVLIFITSIIVAMYKLELFTSIRVQQLSLIFTITTWISTADGSLFFILLLKTHNALPIAFLSLLKHYSTYFNNTQRISLVVASFFLLGPCHILPSIDISPAYIGQGGQAPMYWTALFGYISTWAGPLLLLSCIPKCTLHLRSLAQSGVLLSLFLQRNHLSLWTVYAPRLLFEYGWTLLFILNYSLYSLIINEQ